MQLWSYVPLISGKFLSQPMKYFPKSGKALGCSSSINIRASSMKDAACFRMYGNHSGREWTLSTCLYFRKCELMSATLEVEQQALELHEQILSGDCLAPNMLAELLMPRLAEALRRKYHTVKDEHAIHTAVADAMLGYLKAPQKFNRNRGSLVGYLWMAAQGDLLNSLKQARIWEERNTGEEVVELESYAAEHRLNGRHENPEEVYQFIEEQNRVESRISSILSNSIDREVARLMLDGVRETDEFAKVLGVCDKKAEEQAAVVKRHKDRIKLALRRNLNLVRKSGR